MLAYVRGTIDLKETKDETDSQNFVQSGSGSTMDDDLKDFYKILEEPLTGSDCAWKRKLEQKEFKDDWRLTVHQKKQEG